VGQKCAIDRVKNGLPLEQKCATTNNTTIKGNSKRTTRLGEGLRRSRTATPSPLPPKGTPALLAKRKKAAQAQVQQFKRTFGIGKKKWQPLTEQEFQRRKQAQLKALLG